MSRSGNMRSINDNKKSYDWQGDFEIKPWHKKVSIAIPFRETPELVDTFMESWLLQTVSANIIIIDTGSSELSLKKLREWEKREDCVELHELRFKAVKHPSDPVAIAMDLAFSLCTTKYLFATHADCFPLRNDLIEWMISKMESGGSPVIGYQITDREGIKTDGWVGHTATMFDINQADILNLGWSQRRLCNLTGMDHFGNNRCNGYPDTEFLINEQLDRHGIQREIIGKEINFKTTKDENILHVRSYASSKMYSPSHHSKAKDDMILAIEEVSKKIELWKS